MKRLVINSIGTRGDVQPYLALGRGLQAAGYQVAVCTDVGYADFVTGAGLEFAPVHADARQTMQIDLTAMGSNPLRMQRWFVENFTPFALSYFSELAVACRGADAVLFSTLAFAAAHVAEAYGIPAIAAYLQPFTPTRHFSSISAAPMPEWLPFVGLYNWLSHRLNTWLFVPMIYRLLNRARRDVLHTHPHPFSWYWSVDVQPRPVIYGYSPALVPKPPDWGKGINVCGYWFLDGPPGRQSPAGLEDLKRFLQAGPPPVYVGYGSMTDQDAARLTEISVQALVVSGQRGVLLGGWAGLGGRDLPDNVFQVDSVPHGWLFPQMAAIVHHGGAGTTAAALRSGRPNVVVPYFADQPFWGRMVHARGAGPLPLPRKELSAEKLASAIQQAVTDASIQQHAAALGEAICREDGVGNAVQVIKELV